jgi:hypothetical protein
MRAANASQSVGSCASVQTSLRTECLNTFRASHSRERGQPEGIEMYIGGGALLLIIILVLFFL